MNLALLSTIAALGAEPAPDDTLALRATVVAWRPDASWDHGEDDFAAYDAVELRIDAPAARAGRTLVLLVEQPTPPDLLWRAQGASVCFEMSASLLDGKGTLFVGAARKVRRCDAPPTGPR